MSDEANRTPPVDEKGKAVAKPKPGHRRTGSYIPISSKDFDPAEEPTWPFADPGTSPSIVPAGTPTPRGDPKTFLIHIGSEFYPGQSSSAHSRRTKALNELPDVPEHSGDADDPSAVIIPPTPPNTPRTEDAREDEQEPAKSTDKP